jgi:CheY-like chemotaxis protein
VLLNLCINARDATNGIGAIGITARYEQLEHADCASCHKQYSGNYVVLSVSDDGYGITEAQRTRIFEPFFTTKAEQKGTGMGLATVHGIVHHHGGHIGLVSTIAVGSTFSVALPVAGELQQAGDGAASDSDVGHLPVAPWPARILVVDDEPSIAQCTAEVLEIAGFKVSIETDALRAAERLRSAPKPFDLLVTDQTMPRMTGHQLAVEAMIGRPDLPVLLVTGHSAAVDEEQALALGIRAFLRKPVPRVELLNAVLNALPPAPAGKSRSRRGAG